MRDANLKTVVTFITGEVIDTHTLTLLKEDLVKKNYMEKLDEFEGLYWSTIQTHLKKSKVENMTPQMKNDLLEDIKKQLPPKEKRNLNKYIMMISMYLSSFLRK